MAQIQPVLIPNAAPAATVDRAAPLLALDDLLCQAIAATGVAARNNPALAVDFRKISAVLWSMRDELDLIVSRPGVDRALAVLRRA
jgi:hypothetical protein